MSPVKADRARNIAERAREIYNTASSDADGWDAVGAWMVGMLDAALNMAAGPAAPAPLTPTDEDDCG